MVGMSAERVITQPNHRLLPPSLYSQLERSKRGKGRGMRRIPCFKRNDSYTASSRASLLILFGVSCSERAQSKYKVCGTHVRICLQEGGKYQWSISGAEKLNLFQCFGSGFIDSGSGSSILG
jgi:hypothetical protein